MKLKTAFAVVAILLTAFTVLRSVANEDNPIVWGSSAIQGIEQHPSLVVAGQEFELHLVGYRLTGGSGLPRPQPGESYVVTIVGNSIDLKFANNSDTCIHLPPGFIPDAPQRKILSLPGLPAGTYNVTARISAYCISSGRVERQVTVYPNTETLVFNAESPAESQTVSGVGVIRGWACYEKFSGYGPGSGSVIGRVAYQIDDGDLFEMPYGTSRTDTEIVCGKNNVLTGYGAVTYWGNYGEGEHRFTLYIDGKPVQTNTFMVAAPEGGFQEGLNEVRVVRDFPSVGRDALIRWSEADQNFIIVEFD